MIHEHEMKSAQQHILRPTLRFWLHKNVARLGLSLHFAVSLSPSWQTKHTALRGAKNATHKLELLLQR